MMASDDPSPIRFFLTFLKDSRPSEINEAVKAYIALYPDADPSEVYEAMDSVLDDPLDDETDDPAPHGDARSPEGSQL